MSTTEDCFSTLLFTGYNFLKVPYDFSKEFEIKRDFLKLINLFMFPNKKIFVFILSGCMLRGRYFAYFCTRGSLQGSESNQNDFLLFDQTTWRSKRSQRHCFQTIFLFVGKSGLC